MKRKKRRMAGITQSPNPKQAMDFPSAIALLITGARVTKAEWSDQNIYGQLRNGFLMIHLEDGWHRWVVSEGDMTGEDWYVL
jgi:hypothetical protein